MLTVLCKSKVCTATIVFLNTCLFCKVATTKTYDFKLVWVELSEDSIGNTHYSRIVARNVLHFPNIDGIVIVIMGILFWCVSANQVQIFMAFWYLKISKPIDA